jgi:prophage regulatory protein
MHTSHLFRRCIVTTEEKSIQSNDQLLRIKDVAALTSISKSTICLWVAQDRFPKPISLSKTLKVWRLKDVRQWTESKFSGAENSHG